MRKKIIGIVMFMLVATTVVSATQVDVTKTIETKPSGEMSHWKTTIQASSEPALFDWWCVDQKQTHQDRYGMTLTPPAIYAQRFTPTKDKLTAVSLFIFKGGAPPGSVLITVSIKDNLTGSDLATKTIDTSAVTIKSKGSWVLFDFEDISLIPENTYYLVCSGDAGDDTNAYCWFYSDNDTYTRGDAWIKFSETSVWVTLEQAGIGADFCFKTYFRKPIDVSSTQKTNENMAPINYEVDVPVWKKGDSWTFNEHNTMYRYLSNGTLWFTWSRNDTLTSTVIDDTGGNYTIKESSTDNGGIAMIGSYRLKFTPFTKFTDEFTIRKTDLVYYHQLFVDKGFVFWLFGKINFPLPARYYLLSEASYKSPKVDLPFPLIAGKQGNLPGYSYTYQEKITLYWGLITLYDLPKENFTQGPVPYHCEMAEITVPAGTYNAYNVSVDVPNGLHGHYSNWLYYVPEIGHTAKVYKYFTDGAGKLIQTYSYELVDFNYTP